MELKSDTNGLFIEGMSDSSELADYIRRKFNEEDIQNTYESLTKGHIKTARSEGITPLRKFWQALNHSQKNTPTLKCEKGCAHCCHTGVAATQVEWDGILNNVMENNVNLEKIIEQSKRTIDRVRETLHSKKSLEQVDWHRLVINQPCPFLGEAPSCIHSSMEVDEQIEILCFFAVSTPANNISATASSSLGFIGSAPPTIRIN